MLARKPRLLHWAPMCMSSFNKNFCSLLSNQVYFLWGKSSISLVLGPVIKLLRLMTVTWVHLACLSSTGRCLLHLRAFESLPGVWPLLVNFLEKSWEIVILRPGDASPEMFPDAQSQCWAAVLSLHVCLWHGGWSWVNITHCLREQGLLEKGKGGVLWWQNFRNFLLRKFMAWRAN